jgi:hypothetical protein
LGRLPDQARARVLRCWRMISRGVLAGDGHAPEARAGQERAVVTWQAARRC